MTGVIFRNVLRNSIRDKPSMPNQVDTRLESLRYLLTVNLMSFLMYAKG